MAVVRYWAAAREAAGTVEESYPAATTLGELLASATAAHGGRFAVVAQHCSFLVDGSPVGRRPPAAIPLAETSVVEMLPPFAGG
jgi:molybdopterin converting factor small subunit